MAASPAHRWGQIIGDVLEAAIAPLMQQFAHEHGCYLDRKGTRAVRKTKEVVWVDHRQNRHKLDYVLERGGTDDTVGIPIAFIEVAWRRYTKHSKNKAQEIEAAIQPLLTKHREAAPFFGVVLGGVFTENALTQLRSVGAHVLYFPYEMVIAAFLEFGIDAASEEATTHAIFQAKIQAWESLAAPQQHGVAATLLQHNTVEVQRFLQELSVVATRQVASVQVLPLHGHLSECQSVEEALQIIQQYDPAISSLPLVRYEIQIRYSNGDQINAEFADTSSALQFIRGYQRPEIHPL